MNAKPNDKFPDLLASLGAMSGLANGPGNVLADLATLRNQFPMKTSLDEMPIRTIHHLSCTGGTLFAKCIASMPNVVLLNEINPFSRIKIPKGRPPFTPTDIVALARQGERAFASDELIKELFLDNLAVLRRECWLTGRALVLRDHSHSQFLYGELDESMPTLREVIAERFHVLSVVTTRKPENAFASMERQGWHRHFKPGTSEEYQRRETLFRDKFSGSKMVSYESLTNQPQETMERFCHSLEIGFSRDLEANFGAFLFSGDSGRGGTKIQKR